MLGQLLVVHRSHHGRVEPEPVALPAAAHFANARASATTARTSWSRPTTRWTRCTLPSGKRQADSARVRAQLGELGPKGAPLDPVGDAAQPREPERAADHRDAPAAARRPRESARVPIEHGAALNGRRGSDEPARMTPAAQRSGWCTQGTEAAQIASSGLRTPRPPRASTCV